MSKRARAARREVKPYLSASFDGLEPKHYISVGHTLLTSPHFKALNQTARLVYLYLADWAAGRNTVEISHRVMEQQYGIARASFDKAVCELREAGFLKERSAEAIEQYAAAEYAFSYDWKTRPPPIKVKRKPRGNSKSAPKL